MYSLGTVVVFMCFSLSHCVTLRRYETPDINSKYRTEIKPIEIHCFLGDILVISAPVVKKASYYIFNPKGDAMKINISRPKYKKSKDYVINNEYNDIVVKYANDTKSLYPVNNYRVFNLLTDDNNDTVDHFEKYRKEMNANDFMIGPLKEEDHGNWVLSAYTKYTNGEWEETFQVISILIKEFVPPNTRKAELYEGGTFRLSFAYPINHIETCELTAPRSTFDRFFEKDDIKMASCGYVIRNLTKEDQGTWKITAVGNIIYETEVFLKVTNDTDSILVRNPSSKKLL